MIAAVMAFNRSGMMWIMSRTFCPAVRLILTYRLRVVMRAGAYTQERVFPARSVRLKRLPL